MAENISLQVGIGNSASEAKRLELALKAVLDTAQPLADILANLPGGADGFRKALDGINLLNRGLTAVNNTIGANVRSKSNPLITFLNATATEAQRAAKAINELDVQKLVQGKTATLNSLLRSSSDSTKLMTAMEANQRRINDLQIKQEALAQSVAAKGEAASKKLLQSVGVTQRALTTAAELQGKAQQRLETMLEQQAIQAGVKARQRAQSVRQAFERTPGGQSIQLGSYQRQEADFLNRQYDAKQRQDARDREAIENQMAAIRRRSTIEAGRASARERARQRREEEQKQRDTANYERSNAEYENRQRDREAGQIGSLFTGIRRGSYTRMMRDSSRERADQQREEDNLTSMMEAIRRRSVMSAARASARERAQQQRAEAAAAALEPGNIAEGRRTRYRRRDSVDGLLADDAEIDRLEANRRIRTMQRRARVDQLVADSPEGRAAAEEADRARARRSSEAAARRAANMPEQVDNYRQVRSAQLFGDGGAFLFRIQAQLQAQNNVLNMVFNGFSKAAEAVVEFDKALHQLQAITLSSEGQMKAFGKAMLELSVGTKFSASELTNAAIGMAQAGLSMGQITDIMRQVAQTSLATGEDLKTVTEIYLTAVDVFKVSSKDAATIQNQLVSVLNGSRLNVEKLGTALGSVANIATESGLSFAETTSALAAMSNEGITAGAQLGTGLRMTLLALEEPNEKLRARLQAMGISLADISPKTHGLIGALKNLKDAGFSSADAFATMERRMANAFLASMKSVDSYKEIYEATLLSTGAVRASEVAMGSLENQFLRLGNTISAVVIAGTMPMVEALKTTLSTTADLTSGVSQYTDALGVLGTVLSSGAIVLTANWVLGLTGLRAALKGVTIELIAMRVAALAAAPASISFGAIAAFMTSGPGIILAATAALSGFVWWLSSGGREAKNMAAQLDELRGKSNQAREAVDQNAKSLEALNQFLDSTTGRAKELKSGGDLLNSTILEAKSRFGSLSETIHTNITSFDGLIGKVLQLRQELLQTSKLDLVIYQASLNRRVEGLNQSITSQTGQAAFDNAARELVGGEGPFGVPTLLGNMRLSRMRAGDFSDLPSGANNLAVIQALQLLKNGAPSPEEIARVLQSLNMLKDPPESVKSLIGRISGLGGLVSERRMVEASQRSAGQKQDVIDFAQNGVPAPVRDALIRAQSLFGGGSAIKGTADSTEAQKLQAQMLEPVEAELKVVKDWLTTLTPEAQKLFKEGDLGERFKSLTSEIKNTISDTTKRVGLATIENASEAAKVAGETLSTELQKLRDAKDPSTIIETRRNATKSAERVYQEEMAAILAKDARDREIGGDPAILNPRRDNALARAREVYTHNLQRIDMAGSDGQVGVIDKRIARLKDDFKTATSRGTRQSPQARQALVAEISDLVRQKGKLRGLTDSQIEDEIQREIGGRAARAEGSIGNEADPTRGFIAPSTTAAELERELSSVTKGRSNAVITETVQVKSMKAWIEAAGRSKQIPESLIEQKRRELDAAIAKQDEAELTLRATEIDQLGSLKKRADEALATAENQLEDLKRRFDIVETEDGQAFPRGARNSQDREVARSGYNILTKRVESLRGARDKIDSRLTESQNRSIVLKADASARTMGSENGFMTGLEAARLGFRQQTGLDDSATVQYFKTFETLAQSAAKSTAQFFEAWATGSLKGKNAFGEFARSVVASMLQMAATKASNALISLAFDFVIGAAKGVLGIGGADASGSAPVNKLKAYDGAIVQKFGLGGMVRGPDYGRDTVPAMLAGGEAVLNKRAVSLVGTNFIENLNRGAVRKGASMPSLPAPKKPDMVNVYVVQKDDIPALGPKDVLATIGQDIQQGGPTRQLIRQVMMGSI